MTPNLQIFPSSKSKNKKLVNSRIHKWTIFSLCFITTLIIVYLIKSYLPLLVSALAMLFVWSQMTKPIAEIEIKTTNDNSNQLNLFHRQYKIGRRYSKVKKKFHEKEDSKVA
tara:strand:- start:719 stop:1054 length:336 start_codon:yes stop_codon:yes gene_type:complete